MHSDKGWLDRTMCLLLSVMPCGFHEPDFRHPIGQLHRSCLWVLLVSGRYRKSVRATVEFTDMVDCKTELCKALAAFLFSDEQRGLYVVVFLTTNFC
jgi:hypothetical protein